MKANNEYLHNIINLPEKYPSKPIEISKFVTINFDPLTQYHNLKYLSQIFSDNDDISPPFAPPKRCPPETHNRNDNPTRYDNDSDDDEPPPLVNRRYDINSDED
jgi:hypothetical protein